MKSMQRVYTMGMIKETSTGIAMLVAAVIRMKEEEPQRKGDCFRNGK
jgi:hypothetical protein